MKTSILSPDAEIERHVRHLRSREDSQPGNTKRGGLRFEITKPITSLLVSLFLLITPARAEDVYPTLTLGGLTYTNAQPIEVNPVEILFKADGPVFKRVKRQDLPEGLKDKYPYDPAKAAEYEKEKAEKAKALREQQRREIYAGLQRQEREIETKIKRIDGELVALQRELQVLNASAHRKPKSPARVAADRTRAQKQSLIAQQTQLQQQLEQVRANQTQYR